jgi:hypothetical protein
MWVAVGIAAVGAATSVIGGINGKDAAEKAGEMQADMIERTAQENKRRRELDLQHDLGSITAAVAASNIQMTGSSKRYKSGYQQQYRQEMAWETAKANMDARMAIKTGQMAGDTALYSGLSSAVGYVAQGYGAYKGHAAANGGDPFYLGTKPGPG